MRSIALIGIGVARGVVGIGVDLAGILRGTHGERRRWVGAEWGGVWWGCPLFSRLGGLGECRELPLRARGWAPAENGFWRILKATERSFLYLYDKNLRGQFALASPYSKFWEGLVPRVPPVIYAHGSGCRCTAKREIFLGLI